MKVCIGGTFNILHAGHKKIIDKALELAGDNGSIHIGITIGKVINHKKNVNSFEFRKKIILAYINSKNIRTNVEILPIESKFGLSLEKDYDSIVVSPETYENAKNINDKRIKLGKNALKIFKISYVLADDGKPISSTRIIEKIINKEGKIL